MAPVNFGYVLLWSVSLSSVVARPNGNSNHVKRQLLGSAVPSGVPSPSPLPSISISASIPASAAIPSASAAAGGLLGGLPLLGGGSNPLGAVTGSLPVVGSAIGGSSGPLGAVTGVTGSLPVVGGVLGGATNPLGAVTGVTNSLPIVGAGSSPLGAVTGATSSLPVVGGVLGGVSNPLGAVTGVTGSLPVVGGVLGGATSGNPLGAVTGAASGVVNTATGALGSVPVVGGVANTALNTVTGATGSLPVVGGILGGAAPAAPAVAAPSAVPNLSPAPLTGIPGTDPVGAFSISVIATLLSLLKKDPLSLFAPARPIPALVRRDAPELAERDMEDRMLAKRQLPGLSLPGLPSLSSGLPGVGVGGLPSSGIPGVSPDLAYLVGSIAKNIAIPGGNGLGSVTGSILSVLNGIVPNFLFQLPVVQDSVATFGVLQLLSSINPAKFSTLVGLNSLPALSQAASSIPAGDLAFIKGLPVVNDPGNLISTITGFTDNILSLPGNVSNLKASVAVLSLKHLGLSVAGLG